MKQIKRRINSVTSTKQIMKAMDLVATSKLQKAKVRMNQILPFFENMKEIMDSMKDAGDNVFIRKRKVKSIAYIVIASDSGLCGGYNINVVNKAIDLIKNNGNKNAKIITVGSKAVDFLRRRKKKTTHRFTNIKDATYEDAKRIGELLTSMYLSGEIDEAHIVYTHFESILSHIPKSDKILPIGNEKEENGVSDLTMYDPDLTTFLDNTVPMYINTLIYGAIAEAQVCEFASRMTSMNAATKNASEIIDDLTLMFNRKRQGMITQEITEIVSGANVIK